jgi:dsRNA-specific ribonuclease
MHVEDIAWDVIARAEGPFTRPFDFSDVEGLQAALDDAMISTPAELGRRFYVTGLRTDLTPSSPDPTSEGKSYYEAALAKEPWEYRTRKANVLTWPEQPLVEVEPVVGPKGGGVTASLVDMSRRNSKCVIAEFLSLYFLPASVYRTGTALVSALSTLDDELIAVDLSTTLFNGLLDRAIVREAITSPAAHAYPGGINYERLEILGDTILKFITTTAMYVGLGRKKTEGAMTYDRHKVVSNRALQASIIESGVVPYIRGTNRRARDFVPPGWFLRGTQETGPQKQTLGDKTVADVAEALVAAAYLSSDGDMQAVLEAMDVLHIDVGVRTWAELASRTHPCDPIAEPLTVLGYTFRNPDRGRVAIVGTALLRSIADCRLSTTILSAGTHSSALSFLVTL